MNNKIQLLSVKSAPHMEKAALSFLARGAASALPRLAGATSSAGSRLANLASRRDFLGGLLAPIPKLFGGFQRAYGRAQQGLAVARQGLGSSVDDLAKNTLYQRGVKNVASGKNLRQQAGFRAGIKAPNPFSYRIGRGVGGVALGAPLMTAPFTAAQYAGAASADPELAKEYAKNMAFERVEDRLGQFQAMPFLSRLKATYDPQSFTRQLQAPEALNLYENIANNNINNPGILKYIASFNPFSALLGASPDDIINQKVRKSVFDNLNSGVGSEKQANIFKMMQPALRGLGHAFMSGRRTAKFKHNFSPEEISRGLNAANMPLWRAGLNRAAYEVGKSPLKSLGGAALTAGGAALTPYYLKSNYTAGQQGVYDAAANNAIGLADLQMLEKFNQPGFMGGLGRAGMAIAPGIGSDMILKQIRQSMFPEVSNTVR